MAIYVLRKSIAEDDGENYVIDVAVSKTLGELESLRDRSILFETQDQDDIVVGDHPAGLLGNSFRYLEGYVSYAIEVFEFPNDIEETIFEAEIKARMSIDSDRLIQLLIRNEDL